VAPWPGFEPGSSGRQPLILFRQLRDTHCDRTILPRLSKAKGAERDNADFAYLSLS
jgi:hypothetical protein